MKKPVVLLLLLVALVAFAVYYQKNRDQRMNSSRMVGVPTREVLLPKLPVSEIRQIRVKDKDSEVNVAVEGEKWVVKERSNYTASYDKVKGVVEALTALKVSNKMVIGNTHLGEIQLLPPDGKNKPEETGMLVELLDGKGQVISSFVAGASLKSVGGASSGDPMGGGAGEQRYVKVPQDENTVWTVDDSLYEWEPTASEWLDKNFIKVLAVQSVQVTAPEAADSWAATRKDGESAFAFMEAKEGEELDTAKSTGLQNLLANPVFVDVLTKDQATADFMNGAITVKITTFDGFHYDLKILEKKGADEATASKYYLTVSVTADPATVPAAPADEKEEDKKKREEAQAAAEKKRQEKLATEQAFAGNIYEVSSYPVELLLKKRSELLRDKNAPAEGEGAGPQNGLPPGFTLPPGLTLPPGAGQ